MRRGHFSFGPRPISHLSYICVSTSRSAALASGAKGAGGNARTVASIERRLSALVWNFAQRSLPFDRKDSDVATVLAGVRRTHGRPPVQKEALLPEHVVAMLDALPPSDLRNLRDRAILLLSSFVNGDGACAGWQPRHVAS